MLTDMPLQFGCFSLDCVGQPRFLHLECVLTEAAIRQSGLLAAEHDLAEDEQSEHEDGEAEVLLLSIAYPYVKERKEYLFLISKRSSFLAKWMPD